MSFDPRNNVGLLNTTIALRTTGPNVPQQGQAAISNTATISTSWPGVAGHQLALNNSGG
jgi:hypothetical protein